MSSDIYRPPADATHPQARSTPLTHQPGGEIPTTDPIAALQFCQAFSGWLASYTPEREGSSAARPSELQPFRPVLSVVIPVYDEQDNLPVLYQRLTTVLEGTSPSYEIIFIDDGSRDQSVELVHAMA
ncbi:MAG: glycosyltransferase, partial [Anaerolineales bacterium]